MSKMSELHRELTEQANDLGFDDIADARSNGYEIDYDNECLVKLDEEEQAHNAWLKERDELLGDLNNLLLGYSVAGKSNTTDADIIRRAVKFIREGEL